MTFTATVAAVPASAGTPNDGTVTFIDDGTAIGSAAVSDGTATFTTSSLGLGINVLDATYSGDTT